MGCVLSMVMGMIVWLGFHDQIQCGESTFNDVRRLAAVKANWVSAAQHVYQDPHDVRVYQGEIITPTVSLARAYLKAGYPGSSYEELIEDAYSMRIAIRAGHDVARLMWYKRYRQIPNLVCGEISRQKRNLARRPWIPYDVLRDIPLSEIVQQCIPSS